MAETGGKIAVWDVNLPPIEKRIPNVYYYKCDVSDVQSVQKVYSTLKCQVGPVTLLINNAGITSGKTVMDLSFDEIEQTVQVNLLSSFYTIKTCLPDMLALKRGYIVTVASVLGYMSPARLSAYGASKAGLIALHESLTYELGPPSISPNGVKTLLVCPGQLQTGLFKGVKTPSTVFAPELEPKYVASKVRHAVELGRKGELRIPFYGNFLPILRAVPWPIVEIARCISGIDKSMQNFERKSGKLLSKANSPISGLHESQTDFSNALSYSPLVVRS
ncbi:uncharacterized protein KQ657_000342 [Scheffersomyces spartinae]|uniref:Uncharacterized protein n=1 Tax=Scheffersomyces spartinae TaxID=45513 RepID=A0A9P7V952_9ASCO|nr:uncharacterized protein KQ657_000342 [Scheffersomyces spartinae]KAG7193657.1 hypothetical protein KQ657_000342 [Scheffersomyces spartinae]